jgi:hypothetical protein
MLAVGGVFTTAGGANLGRGVVAWTGQEWSGLGGGLNGFYPWASTLDVIQDEAGIDSLLVGGFFANAGGVAGTQNLARWDGHSWHPIGPALNNGVTALGVIPHNGLPAQLVAGGDFTAAGELPANRIVTRAGNNWVPLGGGVDDSVLSITELVHGESWQIVVGGRFQTAGGAPAGRIAIWDGRSWRPLSTGLGGISSYVSSLATTSSRGASVLYAGGSFSTAGGVPANNIAAWVCLNDSCPGDLNDDGIVNGADISIMLGFWGLNGKPVDADINGDGLVDGADLAVLLSSWGECE